MVEVRANKSWHSSWFHLLLLLLLAAAAASSCHGEKKQVLPLRELQLGDIKTSEKCLPQRSRRVNGATILEMKHQSYCSWSTKSREDRAWKLLALDNARVSSLQSQINDATMSYSAEKPSSSPPPAGAQIPLNSGAKLQTMNYIVTIQLGGKQMTVMVDTGSDLTWVQCKPCRSCYTQEDPLFDPAASPSYQPIPCNSSMCDSLQMATGVSGACGADQPSCNYALSYRDGSYTNGVLARDRIDLAAVPVRGFVFGCGESNQGMFGGTSGLMGLGRSQLSLVSQTIPEFGGVFSYCLPTREFDSSGSLILGNDYSVYKNSTPVVYTRMITDPQQASFYFLNLTGISIGGTALRSSTQFNTQVLIDSGTVITRLVPSVYKTLRDEFLWHFSGYPPAPGYSILDTCFDLAGYKEVDVPTIRFTFDGDAEVDVDVNGVLYFAKPDASQVCLAFASLSYEEEIGIIGNYQQKNLRVVYDTVGSKVGFAEETCGYS
ncbi:unnamed protein product [Musa hybrid cultivar]